MLIHRTAVRTSLVPPAIVLAALGLSVAAALFQGLPVGIIQAVEAIVGAVLILKTLVDLDFGIGILPLVAAAVPMSIGTGTQSPLVAALLFALLLVGIGIVRAFLAHDLKIVATPIIPATLALMVVWIISFLYADATHSPLVYLWNSMVLPRLGQLAVTLISAAVLLLAVTTGHDQRRIKIATWGLIAVGALSIVMFFTGLDQKVPVISTGGLFTMWVVTLSYGQALYNERLPNWLRVGLFLVIVAWMYKAMILQTIWFSGWVPALVALMVVTLFRSRRLFAGLFLVASIAVGTHYQEVHAALWESKVSEGDLTRIGIWNQALDLFRQHLALGTGPAGYAPYYMSLYAGSNFSMSTHSNYMDMVIETGVIGTGVFVVLLLTLLVVGWQARRRWQLGFPGGFAQGAFGGFIGLLVAMSLGDWFIPFVYNQTIAGFRYTVHSWVFLGFLASLAVARVRSTEG